MPGMTMSTSCVLMWRELLLMVCTEATAGAGWTCWVAAAAAAAQGRQMPLRRAPGPRAAACQRRGVQLETNYKG